MKTISTAYSAHLQSEVTTIATCWKATLQNGKVLGFSSHTSDIVFGGVTYQAAAGFTPSTIAGNSTLAVDNLEVVGLLDSAVITEADLQAGLWDYAAVEIFEVNYADLTMGSMKLIKGNLGEVKIGRQQFSAELRGLSQKLQQVIGQIYSPSCRADLGDAKCGINLASYTVTGTVGSVSADNRAIFDAARTEPGPPGGKAITGISIAQQAVVSCPGHTFSAGSLVILSDILGVVQVGSYDTASPVVFHPGSGATLNGRIYTLLSVGAGTFTIDVDTRLYNSDPTVGQSDPSLIYSSYISGGNATPATAAGTFDYGKITFTSGLNNGLSMEVKSSVPGQIVLQLPMPYQIAAGDTYSLSQGCNKDFVTGCKNKFNNVVNFRGEPHVPGNDVLMKQGGLN